jgi:hypothetical protein
MRWAVQRRQIQNKEHQTHVRKTSGMPIIQSVELQGVLQSQALCIRQKRQDLSKKEETQAEAKKGQNRRKRGAVTPLSHLFP